jgi:hypothetical protein
MPKPAHRRGSYQTQAAAVRARAYADETTRCQRCGLTLAEHPPHRNGTPARWDAGHPPGLDGVPGAPLAPEASTCNRSAGAALGNRRRVGLNLRHDY